MFKHVEMQKGAHFTIVCTILLIGLGGKIKKTLQRSMYMNPYKKFLWVWIKQACREQKINVKFSSVGYCLQLLWLVETF